MFLLPYYPLSRGRYELETQALCQALTRGAGARNQPWKTPLMGCAAASFAVNGGRLQAASMVRSSE